MFEIAELAHGQDKAEYNYRVAVLRAQSLNIQRELSD